MGTWARNNTWKYIKCGKEADDLPATPPSGKITITENGTDIDVSTYATADVAVEGGGGSSDFSTATITIVDPDELMESFYCPVIVDSKAGYQFKDDPSEGITVILYDGEAVVGIDAVEGTTITRSGNVTVEDHQYIVTGDATFTFSAS